MTAPENFPVRTRFEKAGIAMAGAELTMMPENTRQGFGRAAEQVLKMMEELEDHDDVQSVSSNFDIDDEVMAQFSAA
jgi:transcriptional/translational regulatory protein YebC/TACO1